MKPTLWYSNGAWICSCIDYTMIPPENTEDYIRWTCAAEGVTPQEAYANWEKECDVYRKELEENDH